MVKNQKGFTIIELLAVIVIISTILAPLMYSLVFNVTTNSRMHVRQSSVSIAEGAVYGFDKLSYTDLNNLIFDSGENYFMFDSTTCNSLTLVPTDSSICTAIFSSQVNNFTFDENHFKVYVYDYNMNSTVIGNLSGVSSPIPYQEVRDVIGSITPSTDPNPGLIRVTVWINYSDDPYGYTLINGLIIGDWTDSVYGQNSGQ